MFQCSKCNTTFSSHDELKNHCQSKWHAFNLMRVMQGRQPATLKVFEALAQELLKHKQSVGEQVTLSCIPCNKTFSSEGTFGTHLQSRSHKTKAAKFSPRPDPILEEHGGEPTAPLYRRTIGPTWDTIQFHEQSDPAEEDDETSNDSDGSWEELIDDEVEEVQEMSPCLLCPMICCSARDTLQHMREEHSFTVPHKEACDQHALFTRLTQTVLQLCRCPQCGRQFLSPEAVQRHMTDKPHLTINPLSKQYRRCYHTALLASRLQLPRTSPESCVFELTLSNGARLTPRSLAMYTRQRLRREAVEQPRVRQRRLALQQANRQATGGTLQTTAGYKGSVHRQQAAECRRRAPERLGVAVRANALRLRIKAQVERAG